MVAPYAGAWIEIVWWTRLAEEGGSLPTRERGLKYRSDDLGVRKFKSLPTRERGLK